MSIEGIDLSTRTTDGGKFFDVSLTPGETLDIGAIDLGVCIQPATEEITTTDATPEELNRDEP